MKNNTNNQEGCLHSLILLGMVFGWMPVIFMALVGGISIMEHNDPTTALVSPFIAIVLIVVSVLLFIAWLALLNK